MVKKQNCMDTEKAKLYGYRLYIKINDIYEDVREDVETRFDTSIYELYRPLSKWKK